MTSGPFRMPVSEAHGAPAGVRYGLHFADRDVPIADDDMFIGRGEDCHIVVGEGLVSRKHARIAFDAGRPFIEDLASANGTFVNQVRLHGRAQLFEGDHIFVGTCEMEVIVLPDEDRPTIPVLEPPPTRLTPGSDDGPFAAPSSSKPVPRRKSSANVATMPPPSADVEAFQHVGRLADKMFTLGRLEAAIKILSSPLEDVLSGARGGHFPSAGLVDVAGRYAVKLAAETHDTHWVDLALEVHLLAVRPLREDTIQQLASLRARVPLGSDDLIAQYYETLRENTDRMGPADRMLCERVACLLPGLGAGR